LFIASLEDNSEPTYASIHPTYKLRDAEFPPKGLSVLQALRFTSPLDELLQPILRYEPESRDIIWASEEELPAVAAKFGLPGARIAWSLASDLATDGGATRSALPMMLRHAAETGAQHWTDQTGAQHPIDDLDFGKSDPFHVRVLIDKVVDADNLRRGMQLGSGWACVLAKSAAGLWRVKAHIANRPLSLVRRRLARRALLTGLSQKRGVNACPFCAGSGKESVCDESLICAPADRSLTDSLFFAPGARSLLQPVAGRIQRTLVYLQQEGVVDLVSPRDRWQPCDEQILRHGYPWARFPSPGRSTRKQVDFYEWQGLLPLVLNRLHLSKDLRWRSALTASVREQTCSFCEGSGINWPALNTTISGKALNEFLKEATFKSLSAMIEEMVPPHHSLRRCIQDACQIGLAHIRIQQSCGDLTAEERRNVRLLALRYAALAEAGYLMSEDDSATCASLRTEMRIAF
jgi:excinuclease UvrABC ATPase subunit